MNKIPTLQSLLSRLELKSENETKKNYIQKNSWKDDFLPLNSNFKRFRKRYGNHVKRFAAFYVKRESKY